MARLTTNFPNIIPLEVGDEVMLSSMSAIERGRIMEGWAMRGTHIQYLKRKWVVTEILGHDVTLNIPDQPELRFRVKWCHPTGRKQAPIIINPWLD